VGTFLSLEKQMGRLSMLVISWVMGGTMENIVPQLLQAAGRHGDVIL
jgi:hypothetical protein